MRKILLIATLLISHSTLSAGIFSWVDASGNVVYGDSPPDTVAAKAITPPKLTVLENFANRYPDQNVASAQSNTASSMNKVAEAKRKQKKARQYTSLKIIAPKTGQSIRANDGDVSIAVSITPKLWGGDRLVVFLNGQEYKRAKSRVVNLSNLDRGEYKLSVEIQDVTGRTFMKSAESSFNVLRSSVLTNKKKPYSPYTEDPSQ